MHVFVIQFGFLLLSAVDFFINLVKSYGPWKINEKVLVNLKMYFDLKC